jgi:hypothetical protein
MLGANGLRQGFPAAPQGAQGSSDDQASQANVAGLDVPGLMRAGRKPRKSRARVPPITPEERSEINRRNATRHGNYTPDRRLTYELCEALVKKYRREQRDLDKRGQDWRGVYPRPPLEELCVEWRDDPTAMTDWLLVHVGPRRSRNQELLRHNDDEPWSPANVKAWAYKPRTLRKRALREARQRDPISLLRDCACDERGQEACAAASPPCDWLRASATTALWLDDGD